MRGYYTSSFVWRMWIEIPPIIKGLIGLLRHPSYEGCGLKFTWYIITSKTRKSSFVWRMWIEILGSVIVTPCWPSSFVWRMWIEIYYSDVTMTKENASSFVWRMWIEISETSNSIYKVLVILRMKDVDWNLDRFRMVWMDMSHPSYEGCGLKYMHRFALIRSL